MYIYIVVVCTCNINVFFLYCMSIDLSISGSYDLSFTHPSLLLSLMDTQREANVYNQIALFHPFSQKLEHVFFVGAGGPPLQKG